MVKRRRCPSASSAARAIRARKAPGGWITWSECSDTITASGSRRSSSAAAQASTGAVPRAAGSSSRLPGPSSGSASRIGPARCGPVRMRSRSGGTSGTMRSTVSRISGRSEASGRSCLGRAGVLTGQKRDPTPPARITVQRWGTVAGGGGVMPVLKRRPSAEGRVVAAGGGRAEELVDARQQLLGAERLGEEVGGAELQRLAAVGVLTLGGEDDDGGGGTVREPPRLGQHLEAAGPRHHDVEQ